MNKPRNVWIVVAALVALAIVTPFSSARIVVL